MFISKKDLNELKSSLDRLEAKFTTFDNEAGSKSDVRHLGLMVEALLKHLGLEFVEQTETVTQGFELHNKSTFEVRKIKKQQ